MKTKNVNRVLVGLAVSAAIMAHHADASTKIELDRTAIDLAGDQDIKRFRAVLELNPIKPMVDMFHDSLNEMIDSQDVVGIDNLLLASTATAKDMDSTDVGEWAACHTACHGACHSACHGSRGWR
tara:strand:+ start:13426 stop:13800 length:375 start_codon:yes stop_codon:yes gene_type:complete